MKKFTGANIGGKRLDGTDTISATYIIQTINQNTLDDDDDVTFNSVTTDTIYAKTGPAITVADNIILQGDATINGTLTAINSTQLNVADRYIYLNNGNPDLVSSGGLVINTSSSATTYAVTGNFVAGVNGVSNPTVGTVAASGLTAGQFVQISGSTSNNGIYEVLSHASNLLTIRGVGLTDTVEPWSQRQFTAGAATGLARNVELSVLRSNALSPTQLEFGKGSSSGMSFTKFLPTTLTKDETVAGPHNLSFITAAVGDITAYADGDLYMESGTGDVSLISGEAMTINSGGTLTFMQGSGDYAIQNVGIDDTATKVLVLDSSNKLKYVNRSSVSSGGAVQTIEYTTPGAASGTAPTGSPKWVRFILQGAGGAGGTSNLTTATGGGGGGAGLYVETPLIQWNTISSYAVTVGAGGAANTNTGGNGGNGGFSRVVLTNTNGTTTTITAYAGGGGVGGASTRNGGGSAGSGGSGNLSAAGASGTAPYIFSVGGVAGGVTPSGPGADGTQTHGSVITGGSGGCGNNFPGGADGARRWTGAPHSGGGGGGAGSSYLARGGAGGATGATGGAGSLGSGGGGGGQGTGTTIGVGGAGGNGYVAAVFC